MKKFLSLVLPLILCLALAAPAMAAGDLTVTKDTHLTSLRNIYQNVTVKSGATLSLENWRPDAPGLEIGKSLTVEAGGKITGGSFIFARGATCTGIDLYYKVAGVEKLLTVTLAELVESDPNDDYVPTFLYDLDTGHYVLIADFSNDPFEVPQPGDDGNTSGADTRTEQLAETLRSLDLFVGSDLGFELDRAPTRVEEVVMLIRLLGKEQEALNGSWAHPFTDVPGWADKYIGYAYEKNLAGGVADDKFGTATPATAQMFATFVLRALGYNDDTRGGTDFTYAKATDFATERGLIAGQADIDGFNRVACVRIMEAALRQRKNGGDLLWRELAAEGVFTEEAYKTAFGV